MVMRRRGRRKRRRGVRACVQKIAKDFRQIWDPSFYEHCICIALHYNCHANPAPKPTRPKNEAASMSVPPTRRAAPWLWIAMGGEMPDVGDPVREPAPKPVLGERGGIKVLLLPSRAGAFGAALLEPGAPALAPAAAAAEASALE